MIKNQKSLSRLNWTTEVQAYFTQEENFLRMKRDQNGMASWTVVSKELNKKFINKNRSGKQCRERYMNYIRFYVGSENDLKWSLEEDEKLFVNFKSHGRKWVQICKQMPNWSQNCLKNRFYGAIRKICRRMNKFIKLKKIKQKQLKAQDIYLDILELSPQDEAFQGEKCLDFLCFVPNLQNSLIKLAILPDGEMKIDEIQNIVQQINLLITYKKNISAKRKQNCILLSTKVNKAINFSLDSKGRTKQQPIFPQKTQVQCQKFSQSTFFLFSNPNQQIQFNLKELGLFYEPRNCCVNQDLVKEVCEIMNEKMEWSNL